MKNGEPLRFKLDEEKRKAVDVLKDMLITPPVLALPPLNGKNTIDINACDTQVECVLIQEQKDSVL